MYTVSIVLLVAACAIALARWRLGVYLAVVMALVQDVLRKLTPDQPAVFIMFAGAVFVCAAAGAAIEKKSLTPGVIVGWRKTLAAPFAFYVTLVAMQAVNSFLRFGNPAVSAIGLLSYLTPFIAMTAAYHFAVSGSLRSIRRFYTLYLILGGAAVVTIAMQWAGFDSDVFGEVGVGLTIYDREYGDVLQAYSGIFRASEIAAWHAAMCGCVALFLSTYAKFIHPKAVLGVIIAIVLVYIGLLTGRRKMLPMVAIFVCVYLALVGKIMGRAMWLTIVLLVLAGSAYIVGDALVGEDSFRAVRRSSYDVYVARSKTAFPEIPSRFWNLGLAPIMWSYESFGLFGLGLGPGTQGVAKLADVGNTGAAEGGFGKIMMELGAPGFFVIAWLAWAFARRIWWGLTETAARSLATARVGCALIALLCANFASFTIATQVFGDIFIMLFLGVTLGAILALPKIAETEQARHARMARARAYPPPRTRGVLNPVRST